MSQIPSREGRQDVGASDRASRDSTPELNPRAHDGGQGENRNEGEQPESAQNEAAASSVFNAPVWVQNLTRALNEFVNEMTATRLERERGRREVSTPPPPPPVTQSQLSFRN